MCALHITTADGSVTLELMCVSVYMEEEKVRVRVRACMRDVSGFWLFLAVFWWSKFVFPCFLLSCELIDGGQNQCEMSSELPLCVRTPGQVVTHCEYFSGSLYTNSVFSQ